jgi:hypothetical protein
MDYPFLIKLGLTFGAVYLALLVPVGVVLTTQSKRWAPVVMGAHFGSLGLAFLCVVAQFVRTVWGI